MNRFTTRRAIRCIALATLSAACLAAPAQARTDDVRRAHALYEDCRWSQAFEAFARLADAGDAEAARIAALMLRHGSALYGQQFVATPSQVQRWLAAAAATVLASR